MSATNPNPLPSAVKVPLPDKFNGEMDFDRVTAFLFSIEQYCNVVGLTSTIGKAQLTAMLLTGDARVWFMHNEYDQATLSYETLAKALKDYFRPADHAWRARESLANCRQRDALNVTGYTTAFKKCVQRVEETLTDSDLLDRYVRGLHPRIARDVLLSMPRSLEEACAMAERVAAVWRYTQPGANKKPFQKPPTFQNNSASTNRPGGYAPMVMG